MGNNKKLYAFSLLFFYSFFTLFKLKVMNNNHLTFRGALEKYFMLLLSFTIEK